MQKFHAISETSKYVYCIDEAVYSEHIKKRNRYEVIDSKDDQLRIKGDNERLIWLPVICFVDYEPPAIISIKIDDEISNPENDCVEVTIEFANGERRWAIFATPKWLSERFNEFTSHVTATGFTFLPLINKENIEKAINELDRFNELIEVTQKV